jgi:prepilin peptidase CpaA
MMDTFSILFLAVVLILAAITDIRLHKIPNLLTYPAIGTALAYHGVNNGMEGFFFGAQGLGVGLAILIIPYLMGGMGAGDAKLMGAVGAMLGPRGVFIAFLFTAIFGGIYGLMLLLARHGTVKGSIKRWGIMLTTFVFFRRFHYIPPVATGTKLKLCYGVAIAVGTMGSVFWRISGYEFPI